MSNRAIAIVGGGLVGLTAACLLSRQRFDVVLVDGGAAPAWHPEPFSNRVSAINIASQKLLESLGVWDSITDRRAEPVRRMEVWDSHSDARIRFDARDVGRGALAHIVENNLICEALLDRLRANYHVDLHFDESVSSFTADCDAVTLGIGNEEKRIDGALVIAADGGRSTLRAVAGIPVEQRDFGQDAVVATIECEKPHRDTAWQCFTPDGPAALLPLDGNRCSLVWSLSRSRAQKLSTDSQALEQGLDELFGAQLGQLQVTGNCAKFSLWHRHAQSYIANRLVLVGDAAHTTHPLAGLGANIGLMDVAALSEMIEHAVDLGKSPASTSTLRRYARWRHGENALVLESMKMFKTAFGGSGQDTLDSGLQRLRSSGFAIANRITPLKQRLTRHAMGLAGDIPRVCR